MRNVICLSLLLCGFVCQPTVAEIQKCTMQDGSVVYQYSLCKGAKVHERIRGDGEREAYRPPPPAPAAAQKAEPSVAVPRTPSLGSGWYFEPTLDKMTGDASCLLMSPSARATDVGGRHYSVRFVILMERRKPTVTLVLTDASRSFHHQIAGTGVKIGTDAFLRFTVRPAQRVMSFSQVEHAAIIERMEKARSVRARVRVWPYEDTADTYDIGMDDFLTALQMARDCAKSL